MIRHNWFARSTLVAAPVLAASLVAWLAFAIARAQTQISATQIRGAQFVRLMKCEGPTGPMQDCTGLYYVELIEPAGNRLQLVAFPAPATFVPDPEHWK